jgi:diketogulonate reductase-like aldo/keto reductase
VLQRLAPFVKVLVKSVTPERIRDNAKLDFVLREEQLERLNGRDGFRDGRFRGRMVKGL